jgi:hypothetical protein
VIDSKVPPRLTPATLGPQQMDLPPELVDSEEFEVEDISAHRFVGKRLEYLTRCKSYRPEEDLWLLASKIEEFI